MRRNDISNFKSLAGQAQALFRTFVPDRSEGRARRLAKTHAGAKTAEYRRLKPSELKKIGVSPKAERFVFRSAQRVTSKTPSISKRQFLEKSVVERTGERVSLEQAAARRKSGELRYSSAAAEDQAKKARATLAHFRKAREYGAFTHVFVNRDGRVQRARVEGRNLAKMQRYRDAVDSNGSSLQTFARMEVYDVEGDRIYPSVDRMRINAALNSMSNAERRRFESERRYLVVDAA
jgi:hypothetical protein